MKLYRGSADCLVDWCLVENYFFANDEEEAWNKAYYYFNYKCNYADGGTVEVTEIWNDEY